MKTPERAWPLWLLPNLSLLSLLPLAYHWNQRTLADDITEIAPGDGDSFGIVLYGAGIVIALVLLVLNALLSRVLRSYPGAVPLFPNRASSARALKAAMVWIGLASLGFVVVVLVRDREWLFIPSFLVLMYEAIALRAVSAARRTRHSGRQVS